MYLLVLKHEGQKAESFGAKYDHALKLYYIPRGIGLSNFKLCLANNELLGNKLNNTELFLSALFHDCGKMWDYDPHSFENGVPDYNNWISTPHKRSIHHISRSAIEWNLAAKYKISEALIDAVTHNILAHHGQRAWGSPVAPKSGAAWMLHLCDGISSRMNDCDSWDPYSGAK